MDGDDLFTLACVYSSAAKCVSEEVKQKPPAATKDTRPEQFIEAALDLLSTEPVPLGFSKTRIIAPPPPHTP